MMIPRSMVRLLVLLAVLGGASVTGYAARLFNGTDQYLQSASTIDLTGAGTGNITVAFWLYWDSFGSNDDLALETSDNFGTNNGAFIVDPNSATAGGVFEFGMHGSGGTRTSSFTQPSGATWHHYLLVIATDAAANILGWLDGTSQTMTVRADTGGGSWGNFTLNVMSRNASSLFGAGRMADLAIWTSALTETEADALTAGTSFPDDLSANFYWQLCGDSSPEPDTLGGVDLNVTGATQTTRPSNASSCGAAAPECKRSLFTLFGVFGGC